MGHLSNTMEPNYGCPQHEEEGRKPCDKKQYGEKQVGREEGRPALTYHLESKEGGVTC